MSLIVTSSADVDETNQLGISIPYQYRNNIKNPLEVPPNSEVAVESVKIQRTPMLDYGNNITTNFWFGERLTSVTAKDSQTSYFIPVDNTILGSKSPQDFAEEFKKVLQEAYSLHPEIDSESIEVNIHLDTTTSQFAGFQYKIPQVGAAPTVSTIPSDDCRLQEMFGIGTYSGGVITASEDETFVQLLPQADDGGPLSFHNGSCIFTGLAADEVVTVGISRPYCNNLHRNGQVMGFIDAQFDPNLSDNPFGVDSVVGKGVGADNDVYMDYCVENNGTDIRVYNFGSALGYSEMREVIYYQNTDGANSASNSDNSSFTSTGTPIPSASMGDIGFEIANEKLTISVSGETLVSINTFNSASFKDQLPLPTSIANWKMYPTAYFQDSGDAVTLKTYQCRTNSTITNNFPENSWNVKSKIATFIDGRGDTEHQNEGTHPDFAKTPAWNNANWWGKEIYERRIFIDLVNEKTFFGSGTIRNYSGIANNLLGPSGRRYENIFIMGQNERYIDTRVEGWQANSALTLGFSPFSINQDSGITHGGGYHGASFTSISAPSLSSQQSTFIRVPTLTHETYNFNTGNPSKILFQIPRFDNSGAETGALYFQNNDKTFIDLKNAAPLRLTDMDVHLVRKDETFAKDLTGSTEVVFVIRQKQKL